MPESIDENADHKNRNKLTKRWVESLPASASAGVWYDDKLAGFGVRVMPSGRRFYFVRYRNKHGRSRWFTIGEHGKVTADAARSMAQRILQTVAVDVAIPPANAKRSAPRRRSATCSIATSPNMSSRETVRIPAVLSKASSSATFGLRSATSRWRRSCLYS
jgi:hypothetical protein